MIQIKAKLSIAAAIVFVLISVGIFYQQYMNTQNTADIIPSEKVAPKMPGLQRTVELQEKTIGFQSSPAVKSQEIESLHVTPQTGPTSEEEIVFALLGAMTDSSRMNKLSEKELLHIILDNNAPQKDRYHAAWSLAKIGSEESLAEIEMILSRKDTEGYIKAAMAEGLGYSSSPRAKDMIIAALENDEDIVVRGAIRGLSVIGDQDAVFKLSAIMNLSGASESVIAEAAKGLGRIDSPNAYLALFIAYQNAEGSENDSFKKDIIAAIGYRDITETSAFFQNILNQKDARPSLRLAAVEAVGDASGDIGSFLVNYLNDADSDIRAEISWALAVAESPGDIGDALLSRLTMEDDAEVRKRLYQALGNQVAFDIESVATLVFKETDLEARLAGYDLLAHSLREPESADFFEQFKRMAIPELNGIALSDANLNLKLSAVITLKRAGTLDSLHALEEIAVKSSDERIVKATGFN